jgi:hypothetical protein
LQGGKVSINQPHDVQTLHFFIYGLEKLNLVIMVKMNSTVAKDER